MAVDKKIKYDDKPVVQGGVDNYLGKQPQVQAPRKWQSSPDKPATELAYITEAEKNLILKANIHGGLEGGPNMGPSGIMSLDSFGDVGGAGAAGGDTEAGGGAMEGRGFSGRGPGQSERDFDRQKANQRASLQIAERAQANRLGYNERANIANRTYGPRKVGTNKFGGVLSGLLGLVNPAFGFLSRGLGFLGTKLGDLRGYNPDGTPRTQAEYEAMVADRKAQTRIGNILGRDAPITEMTQRNLEKLGYTGDIPGIGSTPTSRAIARDLTINPEQQQFATSYLNSISPTNIQQLAQPNIDRFTNPIGPKSVNMPTGIQTLDLGLPSNDLMAGLNRMQKMGLKSKKSNVERGLMSPQEALDSITPFNDKEDPATLDEVKEYYGIA
jgi:hypothetical protein